MPVTISYDDVPIPRGWRLWHDKSRPSPDRWFLEARYHHTGHWKVGLDYRPLDGAFPDFWMPPVLWKYATEIESICSVLAMPTKVWAKKMLNTHPNNIKALESALIEYGEAAKKKKKLLFGTPEGLGANEHKVEAALEKMGELSATDESGAGPQIWVEYDEDKVNLYVGGVIVYSHPYWGQSPAPSVFVNKEAAIPKAVLNFEGKPFPYDPVLFDTLGVHGYTPAVNLLVRLTLVSAVPIENYGWKFSFLIEYRKDLDNPIVSYAVQWVDYAMFDKTPVVVCSAGMIEKMNKEIIVLGFDMDFAGKTGKLTAYFKPDIYPDLFPPHGHIVTSPYVIQNPKFAPA